MSNEVVVAAVGAVLEVTVEQVMKAVEATWASRPNARLRREAKLMTQSYENVLHIWGSLLYEGRSNIERMRLIFERGNWGPCSLHVTNALFPEFCLLAPQPRLVESFRIVVAASKRVDFFQRQGASKDDLYERGRAFAADAINRIRLPDHFNALVDLGDAFGREVWEEAWVPQNMPPKIDLTKAIDHSVL